jgi:hypothetical protein
MFLVDTTTGRVWRYTILTEEVKGEGAVTERRQIGERYCSGLTACFVEVDRLRLIGGRDGSGDYTSELFGPPKPKP